MIRARGMYPRGGGGGGSLHLVLYNHMRTKGIFIGSTYLLIWILGNPLSRKEKKTYKTSPNIQHPIGNYKKNLDYFK